MKKKIIAALCAVALFIPTYIAIAYYINAQNGHITDHAVSRMALKTLDNTEYVFDKIAEKEEDSKEAKKMISFFIEMNDSATEVATLPEPLKGSSYFTAVYRSYNKDRTYKYYFSTGSEESYYIDDENNTYRIAAEKSEAFLNMNYAESLYSAATEPVLTLADSSTVVPCTMTWKYKTKTGNYVQTPFTGENNDSLAFPIAGSLGLNFSIEPDYVSVKVTRNGNVLFDGMYADLTADIIGNTTSTLKIDITAKWYESVTKESQGEANYRFTANVSAPAAFYLGESSIDQGQFVVLTGKNVIDIDKIEFSSNPSINYTPTFYKEGDYAVALIPISLDLEYSSSYVFTVKSGAQTQELSLAVNKATGSGKQPLNYNPTPQALGLRTQSTLAAFNQSLKATVDANESTRYFNGAFARPLNLKNPSIKTGFGRTRKISSTGETYIHTGVDFTNLTVGTQVVAANAGKVVYTGEQAVSGKLVVIDHGYGLKSWYMHMDTITVKVGDIVETGAALGTVGSGGFTDGTLTLHHELTVNGVPVEPYFLWNDAKTAAYPERGNGVLLYLG